MRRSAWLELLLNGRSAITPSPRLALHYPLLTAYRHVCAFGQLTSLALDMDIEAASHILPLIMEVFRDLGELCELTEVMGRMEIVSYGCIGLEAEQAEI